MSRINARIAYGGAITAVQESEAGSTGSAKFRVRIIQPGQGSSGIYTAENLAASAPLFCEGTQMYMDHPSASEDYERPERSVRDLAGKLISNAQVMPDGSLEADCEVYASFADILREKWQDIGVSINAWSYDEFDADGVVPVLAGVSSVDFVTKAGAGGALLEVLECERRHQEKENHMNLDDIKAVFSESLAPVLTRLEALEAAAKPTEEPPAPEAPEGPDFAAALDAAAAVEAADLPKAAKTKVLEAVKAGADVKAAIEAEEKYISEVSTPVVTQVSESHKVPVGASAFGYKAKEATK